MAFRGDCGTVGGEKSEAQRLAERRDANRRELRALVLAFAVAFGVAGVLGGAWVFMLFASVRLSPDPAAQAADAAVVAAVVAARHADADRAQELARLGPPGPTLDALSVARGQQLYDAACFACHAKDGRGVPNLGKDLVHSTFARSLSDRDLVAFVIKGRGLDDPANTTHVPMPPRGGRADYADDNLRDVVAYVRSLQDPRRLPAGPLPHVTVAVLQPKPDPEPETAPAPPASALTPTAAALIAAGLAPAAAPVPAHAPASAAPVATPAPASAVPVAFDPAAATRGKRVFLSCMACHGKTGEGLKGLGKNLHTSEFVAKLSDDELLAFIKRGRAPDDPLNTTHIAMPPKGGNPALSDKQILDVIAYIRSLQRTASASTSAN